MRAQKLIIELQMLKRRYQKHETSWNQLPIFAKTKWPKLTGISHKHCENKANEQHRDLWQLQMREIWKSITIQSNATSFLVQTFHVSTIKRPKILHNLKNGNLHLHVISVQSTQKNSDSLILGCGPSIMVSYGIWFWWHSGIMVNLHLRSFEYIQ